MDLEQCRLEIDKVDSEIFELFNRRMDVVRRVAEYKKENNLPIFNQAREDSIIDEICKKARPEIMCETAEIFKSLMDVSRWYQAGIMKPSMPLEFSLQSVNEDVFSSYGEGNVVAYFGVPGSYSEEAAMSCLPKAKMLNFEYFNDVFDAVENGQANYGVVPIENSSTGAIVDIYDLLKNKGFYIVGEKTVKIEHNLLGVKGAKLEDINEVFSHAQGLKQCSSFLKNAHLTATPVLNTSGAAKMVSELSNISKGAIASSNAGKLYNLDVIASNIQDNDNNYTRFIVICKKLEISSKAQKISVMFSVPHVSGALYRILAHFSYNRLNLLKIESRPVMGSTWEYVFFLDFAGSLSDTSTSDVVSRLSSDTESFTLLGNYSVLD